MDRGFLRDSLGVAGLTLVSRVTGFLRDFVTARFLGAGMVSDAFFVALKIPNMFRGVFAEGAFNSAFIPLFSGVMGEKGRPAARRLASDVFAFLFYALLIITLLCEIGMPLVIRVFAPGFIDNPAAMELAITLSRITFPFLALVALTSFFGAVLNSLGIFKPYAAAPIILNLTIIAAAFALAPYAPTVAHALSWGVSISGVFQLAWLFWIARRHGFGVMSFRLNLTDGVRSFSRRLAPGLVSAGVYHINLLLGSIFATQTEGATSYIYYADRLNQLPVGMIGVAAATVMLPSLSRDIKGGLLARAKERFNDSLVFTSALVLPAAVGCWLVAGPMVGTFFEYGAFTRADTLATAGVLKILALSLPALVYVKLFVNLFYARGDTKTPMKLSIVALAVNTANMFAFHHWLGYIGIVWAISLNNWLMLLMIWLSSHRRGYTDMRGAAGRLSAIALSSAAMGALLACVVPEQGDFAGFALAVLGAAALYGAIYWISRKAAKTIRRRTRAG